MSEVEVMKDEVVEKKEETAMEEVTPEASREAIKAVEAMKAALNPQEDAGGVHIVAGMEWRKLMKALEEEVEKELGKANAVVNDVIAKEKSKCRDDVQKEFDDKEKQMISDHEKEMESLKKENEDAISKVKEEQKEEVEKIKGEHEAELEKMKKLYEDQLNEVQESFRDKMTMLRKEIDQYKEQIEVLMLHLDDPFILQEVQMKQTQEAVSVVKEEPKEEVKTEVKEETKQEAKEE